MTKNNVLLLTTTFIALTMLSATPLAGIAFAEIEDGSLKASGTPYNHHIKRSLQVDTINNKAFVTKKQMQELYKIQREKHYQKRQEKMKKKPKR